MSGRISGLGTGSTRDRLAALNARISQDWQDMGFMPPQTVADPRAQYVGNNTDIFVGANSPFANTGPDPFGQETRQTLAAHTAQTDADYEARMAVADAIINAGAAAPASFGDQGRGRPVTPFAAVEDRDEPAAAMAPPKPRPRPKATSYTIKAGDNPTKIAQAFGMSLKELEAKNPGILKKARRLKIGATVKV